MLKIGGLPTELLGNISYYDNVDIDIFLYIITMER
jgi:hypothetical protein